MNDNRDRKVVRLATPSHAAAEIVRRRRSEECDHARQMQTRICLQVA